MRRYFIMNRSLAQPEDEFTALEMCVGANHTQRYSLDNTKLLIKTTQQDIDNLLLNYPDFTLQEILDLTFCVEYTLEEILELTQNEEWQELLEI